MSGEKKSYRMGRLLMTLELNSTVTSRSEYQDLHEEMQDGLFSELGMFTTDRMKEELGALAYDAVYRRESGDGIDVAQRKGIIERVGIHCGLGKKGGKWFANGVGVSLGHFFEVHVPKMNHDATTSIRVAYEGGVALGRLANRLMSDRYDKSLFTKDRDAALAVFGNVSHLESVLSLAEAMTNAGESSYSEIQKKLLAIGLNQTIASEVVSGIAKGVEYD